jgi:hypothetical protein
MSVDQDESSRLVQRARHVFDKAVDAVLKMLQNDNFGRFQGSALHASAKAALSDPAHSSSGREDGSLSTSDDDIENDA